jgi:hypothetical protein
MSFIRLRRGIESDRDEVIPRIAEPLFTTDSKRLYVGDGETPGGIPVGSGEPGKGVPAGGTTGQRLVKKSNLAYDTEWEDAESGGVTSVNGQTGVVTGLAEQSDLDSHTSNIENPHQVTKTQVGLSNVDNTSDANKPISTATQTGLNAKVDAVVAGTNITVDNTNPVNPIVTLNNNPTVNTLTATGNIYSNGEQVFSQQLIETFLRRDVPSTAFTMNTTNLSSLTIDGAYILGNKWLWVNFRAGTKVTFDDTQLTLFTMDKAVTGTPASPTNFVAYADGAGNGFMLFMDSSGNLSFADTINSTAVAAGALIQGGFLVPVDF